MERLKKILTKLAFPPIIVAVILIPLGFGLLIYSFAFAPEDQNLAYVAYGLSAYALVLLCARVPRMIRFMKDFKTNNRYAQRYFSDAQYRTKVSLYGSLAINLLYSVLQLGSGIYYHSVWFYALAGYYTILAVMRFFLLKETLKRELGKDLFFEQLIYRFCGVLLLVMNLIIAVIVFYIVWQNRGFEHNDIITIAMAAYAFFSVTKAIINLVRYRRHGSPIMSAAKAISLVSALVSILSLETAMISAFGQDNDQMFRQIMTICTGSAVCVAVHAIAMTMIVLSTKQIKKLKGASQYGE